MWPGWPGLAWLAWLASHLAQLRLCSPVARLCGLAGRNAAVAA